MNDCVATPAAEAACLIRVYGLVQGVGFRPTAYRLARQHGLRGWVRNDGQGVCLHVCGSSGALEAFVSALTAEAPALARIDRVEREPAALLPAGTEFQIVESAAGAPARTGVLPDAAVCSDCAREVLDPFVRRFRYPFSNCTRCGPRLSIIEAIPYDRAHTTLRAFTLCPACAAEYADVNDRRFHAQPIACHVCGPRAWLERADGAAIAMDAITTLDEVDATCTLLQRGHIVAIKGLGGFQLACDASNEAAVARLRQLKQRERKPFALMARDLAIIERHAEVSAAEAALLRSAAAPIVILPARPEAALAASVAPGVGTLAFMLPNTPLHVLVLRRMDRPIVLTSGNVAGEPQCIDNAEAKARLGGIADYFLLHNRDIARRVDDSLVRVMAGAPRVLRRARGYAPATLPLPPGFGDRASVLALGGELKNTFCLLRGGEAVLSHHMGDLEEPSTFADYQRSLEQYQQLFQHVPATLAVDLHPEYLSGKLGRAMAVERGLALVEVQHHHAHVAACMGENGIPLDGGPVLGVALDGLGFGADGSLWGGEFLRADYREFERLGTFKPVAMPGGSQAMREPWRNTYAHLMAEMGWSRFAMNYADLDLAASLADKPRTLLDSMLAQGINSPLASSCGRLFDAVAAAVGICREQALYEGQAAIEFEALADRDTLLSPDEEQAYPFAIPRLKGSNLPYVEPLAMWQALLGDLILQTPAPVISARFHKGLAQALVKMVEKLTYTEREEGLHIPVVLTGGVFQNRTLLELVEGELTAMGFRVLTHRHVPANDGGLAFGQALIAAARTGGR
jgi:hydrogenase maturation protein HypF